MTGRHRDDGARLDGYAGEVLAVCPPSGGCVRVVPHGAGRRAACPARAWTRAAPPGRSVCDGSVDPFLELPRDRLAGA